MGTREAYKAGQDAYKEGRDILNIPSHYTETERELFILGYEDLEQFGYDHEEGDEEDANYEPAENHGELDLDFHI